MDCCMYSADYCLKLRSSRTCSLSLSLALTCANHTSRKSNHHSRKASEIQSGNVRGSSACLCRWQRTVGIGKQGKLKTRKGSMSALDAGNILPCNLPDSCAGPRWMT